MNEKQKSPDRETTDETHAAPPPERQDEARPQTQDGSLKVHGDQLEKRSDRQTG